MNLCKNKKITPTSVVGGIASNNDEKSSSNSQNKNITSSTSNDFLNLHSFCYKVCGELVFAPVPGWCPAEVAECARKEIEKIVLNSGREGVKKRRVE